MARTYKRDARGRFAGGGGSSRPTVTGGSLKARSAATRARRKLAGQDPADSSVKGTLSRRSQKGAVTRTGRAAQAAGQANRTKISGRPAGVVGRGGKVRGVKQAAAPALSSRGKPRPANPPAPAPASKGRMKPLRGVGAAVAGNLAGFKGLPVTIRTRSQAAAAQRARRELIASRVDGMRQGLNSSGEFGFKSDRQVFKVNTYKQPNIFGGTDKVRSTRARFIGRLEPKVLAGGFLSMTGSRVRTLREAGQTKLPNSRGANRARKSFAATMRQAEAMSKRRR